MNKIILAKYFLLGAAVFSMGAAKAGALEKSESKNITFQPFYVLDTTSVLYAEEFYKQRAVQDVWEGVKKAMLHQGHRLVCEHPFKDIPFQNTGPNSITDAIAETMGPTATITYAGSYPSVDHGAYPAIKYLDAENQEYYSLALDEPHPSIAVFRLIHRPKKRGKGLEARLKLAESCLVL